MRVTDHNVLYSSHSFSATTCAAKLLCQHAEVLELLAIFRQIVLNKAKSLISSLVLGQNCLSCTSKKLGRWVP